MQNVQMTDLLPGHENARHKIAGYENAEHLILQDITVAKKTVNV